MKLSCQKSDLIKIINTVQKAVSSKSIMPILECIKIDAEANGHITKMTVTMSGIVASDTEILLD